MRSPGVWPPVRAPWRFAARAWPLLGVAVAVTGAVAGAVWDDRAGRLALGWLSPVVHAIAWAGGVLLSSPRAAVTAVALAAATAATFLAVKALRLQGPDSKRHGLLLLAGGAAAIAQGALALGAALAGVLLYVAAGSLVVARAIAGRRTGDASPGCAARPAFCATEAALLGALTAFAAVLRLWALNQLPAAFDGELTVNMVASTSLRGALSYSYVTDLTPSGLVYHLLMFAALRVCGTTLLAARLVSAVAGVAVVLLLYAFLRRVAGVAPALTGALFLAASLIEIAWGRSELFPFGLPDLVVVALCWATYLAIVEERWVWFCAVLVLQKLTYDLYPSGQLGVLIPIAVVAWRSVADRGFARRCRGKVALVAAGAALWVLSLSMGTVAATGRLAWRSPFELNAGKTLWSLPSTSGGAAAAGHVVGSAWRNLRELARRVALRVDEPTHYSPVVGMAG